jgi:hypothetical protein
MPLVALALVLLLPLIFLALMPVSIVLRYRASTARRRARGWIAAVNVVAIALSAAFFLAVAAVMTLWVPRAFTYAVLGLAGGVVLGLLGLALSRWETTDDTLHYTPSRPLVLAVFVIVASRIVYGLWRAWQAWQATPDATSWLAASGAAGSLAAGAVVLGYFLAYHAGVRQKWTRHRKTTVR